MITEQQKVITELTRIFNIFETSEGEIRPHFILTGSSGSGKSHIIKTLTETLDLNYMEINAAQLTKEGTSGNSLSKAMSPLINNQGQLTVCFVDEFDKLFISGNSNCQLAHETTHGVQNEFLKVLESDTASVFHDFGKYININVDNVLFVFAGAFNGEENITLDKLRDFGVKTEFLGRVGLVFNTEKLSLESLLQILHNSSLLNMYLTLFPDVNKEDALKALGQYVTKNYEKNTLGIRMINTLIHQYFIKGGKLDVETSKKTTFQKTLKI